MVGDKAYQDRAKTLLKVELKRKKMSYKDLARLLTEAGWPETDVNLANKISRGGFSAAFLLQCLDAIGCKDVRLDFE